MLTYSSCAGDFSCALQLFRNESGYRKIFTNSLCIGRVLHELVLRLIRMHKVQGKAKRIIQLSARVTQRYIGT